MSNRTVSISNFSLSLLKLLSLIGLLVTSTGTAYSQTITSPTDAQTPLALTTGAPAGSRIEDLASINLFNGNLNFALPLAAVQGRGGMQVPLMLTIERHWLVQTRCDTSITGQTVCNRFVSSMWWGDEQVGYGPGILRFRAGATYQAPNGCYPGGPANLTYTDGTGTEHELRDLLTKGMPNTGTQCAQGRGTNFGSVDGTSMTYVSDFVVNDDCRLCPHDPYTSQPAANGYLMFRDGTRYRIDSGTVTWIRDRNGNRIDYTYETYSGSHHRVKTITDSLGRTTTVNYDVSDATYGLCDQIIVPGFGGTSRTVTITKTSLGGALRYDQPTQPQTYGQLFPGGGFINASTQFNPSPIVSGVIFPNGQSYKFSYNGYGELARIVMPSGGAVDYDFQGGLTNDFDSGAIVNGTYVYRRVVAKRTFNNASDLNSKTQITTYSRPESWAQGYVSTLGYVVIDNRDVNNGFLSYEKHYSYGSAAASFYTRNPYPTWKDGKEYKSEVFDSDRTSVLRRVTQNWQQRAPVWWWTGYAATAHLNPNDEPSNDARIVETVSALEPSGANLISKQSAIKPSDPSVVGFDQHNNQTDVWEYDFGVGAPSSNAVRHVHTDFLTVNPANNISYADPANGSMYVATDPHLRNLPRAQQIYSINSTGTERLVSQSETRYDEPGYPQFSYGAINGWWNDPGAARGNATTERGWLDTAGTWLEKHARYDQCGNVRAVIDAKGNQSQIDFADLFYDGVQRNTFAYPTATTTAVPDPAGQYAANSAFTSTVTYDFNTGLITSTMDANGKTTSYDYTDPLNRIKIVMRPDGGVTTYNYGDTLGSLYVETLTKQDTARSIDSYQFFDPWGRPNRSFLLVVAGSYITSDAQYDNMGRVYRVSNPYLSTGSGSSINPSGLWTTSEFDALGRVISVTTPDGAHVTTEFGASTSATLGTTITVTDQALKKRRSLTDAFGRLTRVDEPTTGGLGDVSSPNQPTSYLYDVLGNLSRVTQGGQQRFFVYDSLSRLLRARNPEQVVNSALNLSDSISGNNQWTMSYEYDNNGNLTTKVDARGVTTTYSYDALNRNQSVSYSGEQLVQGQDPTPAITRRYDGWGPDTNGNPSYHDILNSKGHLWLTETSGAAGTRTTIDEYDSMGRSTQQEQQFNATSGWCQSYTEHRSYDFAGHLISQTYPSGRTVTYNYDQSGRTTSFSGNLGGETRTYSDGIEYSPFGGLSKERFGTDAPIFNKLFYNVRGQLAEILESTSYTGPTDTTWNRGKIINDYSLQCSGVDCNATDNNGNLRRQQNKVPENDQASVYQTFTQVYNYDTLNRLLNVTESKSINGGALTQSWAQAYTYDRFGNRSINQSGTTQSVGLNSTQAAVDPYTTTNRLYAPGETEANHPLIGYDTAGNQTKDHYTVNGVYYDRVYDAENRMVSSTTTDSFGSQTSSYTYDGNGARVKRNVNGVATWEVYGLGGELLAEYAANGAATTPQKEYGYRNGQLLITADAPTTQTGQTQNVEWTNAVGVSVSGNSLTKTAATVWGNAGAASTQTLTSGDGYVEMTVGETGHARIFGFSHTDTNQNWDTVDFGLHCSNHTDNAIYVYESGTERGTFGGYAVGDKLRVSIVGGVVKYSRNGTVFYTSSVTPTYPLRVDAALYDNGATLMSGVVSGNLRSQNVEWTNAVGVSVSGNSLTKTASTVWGNAGAASTQTLTSGDGYVEMTVGETGHARIFGFSHTDTNQNWDTVDFGLHCSNHTDNAIYVYESGTERGTFGGYAVGDKLRVSIVGGVVKYSRNGSVFYTSTVTPTYPLRVDAALYDTGATLMSGVVSGNLSSNGSSSNIQWLVTDQLGTPRMVFDKTGSLANVKRHDYLPFGEELTGQSGRSQTQGYSLADNIRQKFTQKERDIETGLDYFGARYYASTQGRFISVDPALTSANVATSQSWNRYAYSFNNPLRYIDPTGAWNWSAALGGGESDACLLAEAETKAQKKKAQGIIDKRNLFRNGLNAARAAGARSDEPDTVARAVNSYGSEGDSNGVTVTFGSTPSGTAAEAGADPSGALRFNADGSVTAQVLVTINSSVTNMNELSQAVGHEGWHTADRQSFAAYLTRQFQAVGGAQNFGTADETRAYNSAYNRTVQTTELGAYIVSGLIAQGRDALGNNFPNSSFNGHEVWNNSWSAAERPGLRAVGAFEHVTTSPTYFQKGLSTKMFPH